MKKRFAKFQTFHVDSDDHCYPLDVIHHGSFVRVTDETGDTMDFSPEQWVTLTERIHVEDVPEPKTPGQRFYEEAADVAIGEEGAWHSLPSTLRARYESAAARLGIKPEGE